ncbi:carbohydrate sulfotransferase 1-like [Argopecten irradians]|uniref:carbohydrate sulfotransferase 1-like n=1 Tax=Argopecten irradians TaxID=31199 RepID=UPI0037211180
MTGTSNRWKKCILIVIFTISVICFYEYTIQTKPTIHETVQIGTTELQQTEQPTSSEIKKITKVESKNKSSNKKKNSSGKSKERLDAISESKGSMVLLVTYLRSGSSFLGEIVQQVPNAIYSFEPIRPFMRDQTYLSTERGTCLFSSDNCSRTPDNVYNEVLKSIKEFYECNLKRLPKSVLKKLAWGGPKCYQEKEIEKCLSEMNSVCKSGTRILKTIRLSMDVVDDLMYMFPDLKVIHLLRDPRGMLASRMKTLPGIGTKQLGMSRAGRAVCDRYDRDIRIAASFGVKYPNRIKTVLYEQVVENPLDTSFQIFNFLGLQPKSNFDNWMKEHMTGDQSTAKPPDNRSGAYSTYRANSSLTMNGWRTRLDFKDVVKIDKECSYLYEYTGYLAVENPAQLQDMKISLRQKNEIFP